MPDFIREQDLKWGVPRALIRYHIVGPRVFVDTLCGAIERNNMETRADVQSFDFRTLILVEEQFPAIPTYYLTEDSEHFSSEFVPAPLRQMQAKP